MVEVVNRQRRRKMATESWRRRAEDMLKAIGRHGASVTIAFVSDTRMRKLNRSFRGFDMTTDVLSFPVSVDCDKRNPDLGDLAVSVDRAMIQADENGLSFEEEVAQLILHGLLHLCGYDHEADNGEMNRLELRLRRKLRL
jgi:probable rRNA maturation factor